ncbi:glycosyltransferase involved in cell wall biosynthesis [Gillisia sp. Hel_I_86]|uniref:glycosyltransferase family 4 protein n=1 Tax=Gillisia sp. Hel_I_86 TaxID=1249981 RepID=UPI00119B4FFD|nr:glycosyltransferase family 4 protein [Gillisia sp. Hel_I_86]TVZ25571.1 glycosyltransferase involved in cell wall biosynthesis [Gillisia sp. Hel_I_86]
MPTQKKILVVVESIDVEDSSGSKANLALIKNLNEAGLEVLVYHYTRKEMQIPEIQCVAIKEKRWTWLFFLSRLERQIRYKLKIHLNKPLEKIFGFSFTLFNDRNSIITALGEIKDFEPDLVLTLSKGGSFRPHHALLKIPKWHKKWIAYIHDPYPFAYYPRPYDWVEPGHEQKRMFFVKVSQQAAFAAYPSLLLAEWMESYFPFFRNKRLIIPHQIQERKSSIALPDFFDKSKFNIVHAGALMGPRNPLGLLKAFELFLHNNPEAKLNASLIMIGRQSQFSKKFQEMMIAIPQFYASEKTIDFDTVYKIQQDATVNVILEAKASISPFLPGKFPHCIASGKPILLLGPNISESHRLLGKDYLYWSEISDIENIQRKIETLYQNWKEEKDISLNRMDLNKYLSVDHLKNLIKKVV